MFSTAYTLMDDALSLWLQSREAADAAARSTRLTSLVTAALARHSPVRVLDLATGAGSNLRYLIPRLPSIQEWLVVDRSARLLSDVQSRTAEWGTSRGYVVRHTARGCDIEADGLACQIETRQLDLGVLPAELFKGRHLVTGSALLDLVSDEWMRSLAAHCKAAGAAALFTITYDGRSSCSPSEPEDEMVRHLLNQHQGRDKGLGGPAAGPDAAASAIRAFTEAGFRVESERSDWSLGIDQREMQQQLIEGWAEAALETADVDGRLIRNWLARRLAHLTANRSHVTVGHVDVAAIPV